MGPSKEAKFENLAVWLQLCDDLGVMAIREPALWRSVPLGLLLLALIAVPILVFSPNGLGRLTRLRAEQARTREEISRISDRVTLLRAEVQQIRENPSAVERVARDQLGLIRRREVVFQFQP